MGCISPEKLLQALTRAATSLGLRKGEICGLKRTDLSDGVLTLQRQRNWIDGEKSRLKQRGEGEVRRIGLPQEIIDRLLSFWDGESIYLFTNDLGKPISYNHLDRLQVTRL